MNLQIQRARLEVSAPTQETTFTSHGARGAPRLTRHSPCPNAVMSTHREVSTEGSALLNERLAPLHQGKRFVPVADPSQVPTDHRQTQTAGRSATGEPRADRGAVRMNLPVKPIYVDLPTTASVVSLSVSTIEKLVRENAFPAPRMLSGRRVAWLLREVEVWCEQRPVSNLPPPPNTGRRNKATPAGSRVAQGALRVD